MSIKLKKINTNEWLGNGMGNSAAQWAVKGAEHIEIWKDSFYWNITNTKTGEKIGRWLNTRAMAVTLIEALIYTGDLEI